jgi:16S rRNA (cytosine967-C5)-methyltransferase
MVKPGGKLIYSTCSIFPSENEKQVESFLKLRPEFQLTKQKSILPSEGYDGFYMAELKKIN